MFCENCGKSLIRGYNFCLECGTPVPPQNLEQDQAAEAPQEMPQIEPLSNDGGTLVFCQNCGMRMQSSTAYCEQCGQQLQANNNNNSNDPYSNLPKNGNVPLWNTEQVDYGYETMSEGEIEQINKFMSGGGIEAPEEEYNEIGADTTFDNAIGGADGSSIAAIEGAVSQMDALSAQYTNTVQPSGNEMPAIGHQDTAIRDEVVKVENFAMDTSYVDDEYVDQGALPVIEGASMEYDPDEPEPEDPNAFVMTPESFESITPKYEEPATEEPVYEEPAVEEPVYEEPAVEAPVYEEPAVEAPVCEEPAVEAPVYEEPAVEAPVYEEPAVEAPVYEEPAVEAPVYEEPAVEEPVVEEEAYTIPLYGSDNSDNTYSTPETPEYSSDIPLFGAPESNVPAYEEPAVPVYEEAPVYEEPTEAAPAYVEQPDNSELYAAAAAASAAAYAMAGVDEDTLLNNNNVEPQYNVPEYGVDDNATVLLNNAPAQDYSTPSYGMDDNATVLMNGSAPVQDYGTPDYGTPDYNVPAESAYDYNNPPADPYYNNNDATAFMGAGMAAAPEEPAVDLGRLLYCRNCGQDMYELETVCKNCGAPKGPEYKPRKVNQTKSREPFKLFGIFSIPSIIITVAILVLVGFLLIPSLTGNPLTEDKDNSSNTTTSAVSGNEQLNADNTTTANDDSSSVPEDTTATTSSATTTATTPEDTVPEDTTTTPEDTTPVEVETTEPVESTTTSSSTTENTTPTTSATTTTRPSSATTTTPKVTTTTTVATTTPAPSASYTPSATIKSQNKERDKMIDAYELMAEEVGKVDLLARITSYAINFSTRSADVEGKSFYNRDIAVAMIKNIKSGKASVAAAVASAKPTTSGLNSAYKALCALEDKYNNYLDYVVSATKFSSYESKCDSYMSSFSSYAKSNFSLKVMETSAQNATDKAEYYASVVSNAVTAAENAASAYSTLRSSASKLSDFSGQFLGTMSDNVSTYLKAAKYTQAVASYCDILGSAPSAYSSAYSSIKTARDNLNNLADLFAMAQYDNTLDSFKSTSNTYINAASNAAKKAKNAL